MKKTEMNRQNRQILRIAVLSFAHMGVDFLCAFSLYHSFADLPEVFLLYNFCAFALQMPIGLYLDHLNERDQERAVHGRNATIIGMILTIAGSFVSPLISGIGNALFHTGGGLLAIHADEMEKWKGKGLGIFVAPGALGLILGSLYHQTAFYSMIQIIACLLLCVLMIFLYRSITEERKKIRIVFPSRKEETALILLCFLVVVLRSLTGMAITFPWKRGNAMILISVLFLAGGKAAGGFLMAKAGMKKAVVSSLLASALFYVFANQPLSGLLALFFFNMSMPMTLYLISEEMEGLPGFGFGILTFGLFLGYLPILYGFVTPLKPFPYGSIFSLLSLIALLCCLRIKKNG